MLYDLEYKCNILISVNVLLQDMETKEYTSYSNWKPGSGNNNCAFVITGEKGQTGKWGDSYCSPQSPR